MEDTNNSIDGLSSQQPIVSTITTISGNGTNVNQALDTIDDLESDTKWEMTTLEKASFEPDPQLEEANIDDIKQHIEQELDEEVVESIENQEDEVNEYIEEKTDLSTIDEVQEEAPVKTNISEPIESATKFEQQPQQSSDNAEKTIQNDADIVDSVDELSGLNYELMKQIGTDIPEPAVEIGKINDELMKQIDESIAGPTGERQESFKIEQPIQQIENAVEASKNSNPASAEAIVYDQKQSSDVAVIQEPMEEPSKPTKLESQPVNKEVPQTNDDIEPEEYKISNEANVDRSTDIPVAQSESQSKKSINHEKPLIEEQQDVQPIVEEQLDNKFERIPDLVDDLETRESSRTHEEQTHQPEAHPSPSQAATNIDQSVNDTLQKQKPDESEGMNLGQAEAEQKSMEQSNESPKELDDVARDSKNHEEQVDRPEGRRKSSRQIKKPAAREAPSDNEVEPKPEQPNRSLRIRISRRPESSSTHLRVEPSTQIQTQPKPQEKPEKIDRPAKPEKQERRATKRSLSKSNAKDEFIEPVKKSAYVPRLVDLKTTTPTTSPTSRQVTPKRLDTSFDEKKYQCEKCEYSTDRLNNIVYHKTKIQACKKEYEAWQKKVDSFKYSRK